MIARLLAFFAVALALVGGIVWSQRPRGPLVVSGTLEARQVRVGSRVGGRLHEVLVAEGALVTSGQVLAVLEPFDLAERVAQARAEREARAAALARLEAGARPEELLAAAARRDEARAARDELRAGPRPQEVRAARHALSLAEAELELALAERDRVERLVRAGAATDEQRAATLAQWKVAAARLEARREELALLEEGTRRERVEQAEARLRLAEADLALAHAGATAEDLARARHELEAAEAAVAALEQARTELLVRAPCDAAVLALELDPGDLVAANAPLAALVDRRELWVRAYVPAPLLPRVHEGAALEVRVDGFARPFAGRVGFVAVEAEFTPSNVQTPEERVQQVFRVKVVLEDPAGVLRPGMSADVVLGPRDAAP